MKLKTRLSRLTPPVTRTVILRTPSAESVAPVSPAVTGADVGSRAEGDSMAALTPPETGAPLRALMIQAWLATDTDEKHTQ